ncbi:MAG: pteridine-dependent deoxygenase [Rhodanobacter sp.]|jgi:chorismate lyase/3-hydroxybenzoate synthase|nr:pteridine-dependent deoxygenase [Rhodanobacter sp.]
MIQSELSLRLGYERGVAQRLLEGTDVLAVFGFGAGASLPEDPRAFRVGLEPVGAAPLEVWRTGARVQCGRSGEVAWSTDGEQLFFAIEADEAAHGGIADATAHAYRTLIDFVRASATPHVLRLWNYLDAINLGAGDGERYRLFCSGRTRGANGALVPYPAATVIGRKDGVRVLQVYGLAARRGGVPVENPRQVSAWHYPRQYGPNAPTFARGMLTADAQLLVSGTAAVVGHASLHRDDLRAQIEETRANLVSLAARAYGRARLGTHNLLKAYVRDPADADSVSAIMHDHTRPPGGWIVLAGDICRAELLVEIDGVYRPQ